LELNELIPYFRQHVIDDFKVLITEFKMKFQQESESVYVYESQSCRVTFALHKGHLPQISIIIVPNENKIISSEEYGLGPILEALHNPEAAFSTREINRVEDLEKDLLNAKEMLLQFCKPILNGDFTIWPKVQENVDAKILKWKRAYKKKGEASRKWQMHEMANAEFGRRNYMEAISLWNNVRDEFDEDEMKKYAFAKSRLSNS
jgi:hypothetical protein